MNELVGSLEDLLRRTTGELIDVRLVLDASPCYAECDTNQLENVLLNLAIDARDAMPDGGMLTIETAHVEVDDRFARTQQRVSSGHYVALTVSDTGVGMPLEVAQRAFELSFTTKPLGQGTGARTFDGVRFRGSVRRFHDPLQSRWCRHND
jgi:signal transduction histidine kinase